jgi:hypothetical protein
MSLAFASGISLYETSSRKRWKYGRFGPEVDPNLPCLTSLAVEGFVQYAG